MFDQSKLLFMSFEKLLPSGLKPDPDLTLPHMICYQQHMYDMSSVTEGQEPVSSVRKRPGNDGVALLVICVARLKPSLG